MLQCLEHSPTYSPRHSSEGVLQYAMSGTHCVSETLSYSTQCLGHSTQYSLFFGDSNTQTYLQILIHKEKNYNCAKLKHCNLLPSGSWERGERQNTKELQRSLFHLGSLS